MTTAGARGEALAPAEDRGTLRMHDRVVEKVARGAAGEVEAGRGHYRRVLGVTTSDGEGAPKVDVTVHGDTVTLTLTMAMTWPAPVRTTAQEARTLVKERVETLTGKNVGHVDVVVPALLPPARPEGREIE